MRCRQENFINSFFESISGFTTTGASVLGSSVQIESLSRAILLWRSQTLAWRNGNHRTCGCYAATSGSRRHAAFQGRISGPTKEKLRPRIRQTAATLWLVYLAHNSTGSRASSGRNACLIHCHTFTNRGDRRLLRQKTFQSRPTTAPL